MKKTTTRAPLESALEKKLTAHAVSLGVLTLKLNVVGRRGWPDRVFLYHGNVLFVELKRAGEKPEPLQEWTHQQLRNHGFEVFVIDDLVKGMVILEEWVNVANHKYLATIRPSGGQG